MGAITAPFSQFFRDQGIGHTKAYELLKKGEVDSVLVGRRRLIIVSSYNRYVERLQAEGRKLPRPGVKKGARAVLMVQPDKHGGGVMARPLMERASAIRSPRFPEVDLQLFAFHRDLAEALTDWWVGYGSFWRQHRRGLPRRVRTACAGLAESYRAFSDAIYDVQTAGRPAFLLSEAHLRLSAAELYFCGALADWLSRFLVSWLQDGDEEVLTGVELGILLGFLDASFDSALAGADEPNGSPLRETCGLFSECCVDSSWRELLKLTAPAVRNHFFADADHASGLAFGAVETLSSVFGSLAVCRRAAVARLRHAEAG